MDEEILSNLKDFIAAAVSLKGVENFLGSLFFWVVISVCVMCVINITRRTYNWYKKRHAKS